MRTATALAVVAVGAILAFAVTAHPAFFNLQIAGGVLIIVGVVGLVIPRRGHGRLRGRLVSRRARPREWRRGRPLVWSGGPLMWRRKPASSVAVIVEEASGTPYLILAPNDEATAGANLPAREAGDISQDGDADAEAATAGRSVHAEDDAAGDWPDL